MKKKWLLIPSLALAAPLAISSAVVLQGCGGNSSESQQTSETDIPKFKQLKTGDKLWTEWVDEVNKKTNIIDKVNELFDNPSESLKNNIESIRITHDDKYFVVPGANTLKLNVSVGLKNGSVFKGSNESSKTFSVNLRVQKGMLKRMTVDPKATIHAPVTSSEKVRDWFETQGKRIENKELVTYFAYGLFEAPSREHPGVDNEAASQINSFSFSKGTVKHPERGAIYAQISLTLNKGYFFTTGRDYQTFSTILKVTNSNDLKPIDVKLNPTKSHIVGRSTQKTASDFVNFYKATVCGFPHALQAEQVEDFVTKKQKNIFDAEHNLDKEHVKLISFKALSDSKIEVKIIAKYGKYFQDPTTKEISFFTNFSVDYTHQQ